MKLSECEEAKQDLDFLDATLSPLLDSRAVDVRAAIGRGVASDVYALIWYLDGKRWAALFDVELVRSRDVARLVGLFNDPSEHVDARGYLRVIGAPAPGVEAAS